MQKVEKLIHANYMALIFFCIIYLVVVHHIKKSQKYTVNHNKFDQSRQHMLHVSVIADHPQALYT